MTKFYAGNIRQDLLSGKPLNISVIDCHAHIGQWFNFHIPAYDEISLIRGMDLLGINRMCISALASIGPDFIYGNEWVHKVVNIYPKRFFGYIGINPNYPDMIELEIKKHWDKGKMAAVKIHPETHDSPPDGKEYRKAYEFLQEQKGFLLSHVWGISAVNAYEKLAREYEDVTFILGHSGGTPKAIYRAIELANKYVNIYLDITGSFHYDGMVEFLVKQVGSDRILFGTDAPFLDPRPAVGRIGYADISDEEKQKILGLNMKKIMESYN